MSIYRIHLHARVAWWCGLVAILTSIVVVASGAIAVADIGRVGENVSDRTPSGLWPSDHAGVVATLRIPKARGHGH